MSTCSCVHRLVVVACAVALPTAVAAEAPRLLTPEDYAAIRRVGDPQISPNGDQVVYTVGTADLAADKNATNLWLASWDGTTNRPLTFGDNIQSHPRWSPDGLSIAFLSSRSDEHHDTQLWILPVHGGEAQRVTEFNGGVDDFAWAPDSQRLVLVVRDPDPAESDGRAGSSTGAGNKTKTPPPIVIDRYQFKRDKVGYLTDRHSHLRLLSLATRKVEPLTSGLHDDLFPTWSPDGATIAFMSKRAADPDRSDEWSLLAIEARPGAEERVVATTPETAFFRDEEQPLAWSSDGRSLAFVEGGDPKLIEYASSHLASVASSGGPVRVLTGDVDRNVGRPCWSENSILFTCEDDGAVTLMRAPQDGGARVTVVGGRNAVKAFTVANNRVVTLASSAGQPLEVFAVERGGLRPLSKQNDTFLAHLQLARVEETRFRSQDGTEVHGFVFHPVLAPATGRRPPALLRLHGGPQSQFDVAFDFEKQLFAANGYLVIVPNPRGSTGRGTAYSKALYADWGRLDVEDDLAAVNDAIVRGLADPDQLGIGGWSYGAMATFYTIATTPKFKAATAGAGAANILSGYGTNQYVTDYEHELGTPWQNPEAWIRVSFPFFHADRIKTPTLILCGEKDLNVPALNSEQMYQALRSVGVPTELVLYPGQYHTFSKPSYIVDRYRRYLDWYAKWIQEVPAKTP